MTIDPAIQHVALPLFAGLVMLEIAVYAWRGGSPYRWRESLASIGVGVGSKLVNLLKLGVPAGVVYFLWDRRLVEVPLDTIWGLVLLFLGVEFAYYWFHRLSHEIRWLWATHAVHHSPEHLTVLAAYRLGWTGLLSGGWLLFMPLIVLGFHPAAVFLTLALNLLYQSWIHTDLIPRLGWLEYVLNTPSNHRVHHATNADYLDRNYGGVLIVFDRLFGTYVEEREGEPCKYGLVSPVQSHNPVAIAFHEWLRMARDARTARSPGELIGYLFGPPGWKPDGKGTTSADIRKAARGHLGMERAADPAVPAKAIRWLPTWLTMMIGVAILGGAATTFAVAQQPAAETRQACMSDYRKHCSGVVLGGGRVIACMQANAEKLTPACREAVRKEAQARVR